MKITRDFPLRGIASMAMTLVLTLAIASCGGADADSESRYTGFPGDKGPRKDREAIMAVFQGMHEALADGDAAGVCAGVSPVELGVTKADCRRNVAMAIDFVEKGEVRWPKHELVWVRSYGSVGGVTVRRRDGPEGPGSQIPFQFEQGKWGAEIYSLDALQLLNAEMPAE